jgi:predicted CXXCH cytochrome family protein
MSKRMVAGYYLFLCLIGFAVLLGPTGAGIPITIVGDNGRDHEFAAPGDSVDPEDCITCHSDQYDYWNETEHANHIYTNGSHVRIGAYVWVSNSTFNASCSECHTSGWENNSGVITFDNYNVNCMACHNSTGNVDYSGEACADCHRPSGEEHPHQYVPWQNSAHANSLTDLRASSHAADYCMHCMSTEGFVHQQNPDQLGSDVDTDFDPEGAYNAISCPACHALHANWSLTAPGMIRAVNATQLCAECHTGARHTTYNIWYGGSHHLAGVECIDCHGYDVAPGDHEFLNHTFLVNEDVACGQSDCHDGEVNGVDLEEWALNQLEVIHDTYEALVEEITTEAEALRTVIETYNATEGADHELVNEVAEIIDAVEEVVTAQERDGSSGFHDPDGILSDLNEAYVDLLNAKAYYYENVPADTAAPPPLGMDTLVLAGGAIGGIVIGLVLGILVGRRR